MDIQKLKDMLIRHEGLRNKPYADTRGFQTIGVGRNLDTVGITREEAEYLLENDIGRTQAACRDNFDWFENLTDNRKMAVIDMVFNMGLGKFFEFKKTIAYIEQGDFNAASEEMLNSAWSVQVGARAKELSEMMRNE
ncbi:MAG: glycoside hydrolase family protein [Patescibacteria group bacterium]|nr:glycoside hydrolase family protein [Patescibacteria group bacterium]